MTTPQPPFRRLADAIVGDIAAGRLRPGDQLPSIAQLAATHGMHVSTVSRALDRLKAQGGIVGVPGVGTFVAEHPPNV